MNDQLLTLGATLGPDSLGALQGVNLVDVPPIRVREPSLTAGPPRAVEAMEGFLGGLEGGIGHGRVSSGRRARAALRGRLWRGWG
jgi:hypothetical protein